MAAEAPQKSSARESGDTDTLLEGWFWKKAEGLLGKKRRRWFVCDLEEGVIRYFTDEKRTEENGRITVASIADVQRPSERQLVLVTSNRT